VLKSKVEYYDQLFKVTQVEHVLPRISYTVKEKQYSYVKLGEYFAPPFGKKNALLDKTDGDKMIFLIPRTGKKSELSGLRLLDWLKTKIASSSS
jgi:hypothetical protein